MMRLPSALAAIVLMGWMAAPSALPQSVPSTAPPSGQYGVTLTIAELLDRQANAPPPVQGQSPRRHTRPGIQSAQKRLTSSPSKPAAAGSGKIPQTVGTTFQGDSADVSVIFPPDCGGAVGPTQFVVATNHVIAAYNKQTSALNFSIATSVFFSAVLRTGLDAVDPRVRFDRLSQRWFLTTIEASLTTNNVNNRVMIAVSNGPQLTSGSSFTFFFFEEDLASPAGDSGAFADYDTLGVDANALYIGVNIFGASFNTTAFVVQKSSVLGAGPMNVTAFRGLVAASGSGIFTPQGVNNDDPAATEGYFIGPDAATTAAITGSVSTLIVKRISNPGSTTPSISGDLTVSIPTATFFSEGVFTTGGNIVDDLDLRLFMATIKNVGGVPALWATHNIQYNNGNNDAVAWYKIGSLTTTPTLLDNGSILGTNPTESCWMPSLAVSGQGHMVVAYNFTSPTERIGARMASHLSTDPAGFTQPATLLQQSSVDYQGEVTPPGAGIARWGDFSFTSVDPNDNMTVWTIQELALTPTAWQVQVYQLKAPPPPTLTSASPSSIQAGLGSVTVTVTGTAGPGQGFYEPGVAFPQHLVATLHNPGNGQNILVNSVTVVDATHLSLDLDTVGLAAGGFTLTVTNPDQQSQTSAAGFVTIAGTSVAPSCVIIPGPSPTRVNPVFTVNFSASVTGLTPGNFVLTNNASAVLAPPAGPSASYTLTVTPSGSGPEVVTCMLPAGVVSGNTRSNTASVTYDSSPLTATITAAAVASNQNPLLFSVSFNKPVAGVVAGSFTTSSGSIGAVTGSGAYWSVGVTGPAQGTVTLTLPAGRVTDAEGNPNALATGSGVYDVTAPVLTITPPGPATNQSSISFTITLTDAFDQVVGGLTLADISVINGTAVSLTGTGPYTLVVNPTGQGTVTVQVNAGSLQDQAGNLNGGATGSTIYDTVPPDTSLTSEPPNPSGSSSATFTFSSTKPGNNFQVQLDGGAVTPISTNTITYSGLAVGTHSFSVAAVDAAGNVDPTPATYSWTIMLVVSDGAAPLLYSFDSQAFIVNWTVSAPTSGVGWEVDASPATVLGTPSYFTAPASLNYNNGVDYNTPGVSNSGTARSPAINRSAIPTSGWVKFMCNYQTDNGATTDLRTVNIYQGATATVLLSTPLSGATCAAMGTWHEHAIPLQNAWTPSVSVQFSFNTVDAVNNTGAGWFVDDLEISDLVVSGLHQYPAGVGIPIPVGGATTAFTLDFKGVVSTVAASASLDVEVVPVATAFTGTPTASSPGALPPGQPISVRITVPSLGSYHWRARTVDSVKGTSAWMDFGVNQPSDPDFLVVSPAPPPGGGGGGGGGGGCGFTGLEGIVLLAILRRFARRSAA